VIAAKYAAVALVGAAITAFVVASTLGVAALTAGAGFAWAGVGAAIVATIAAGIAFAVVGVGIGAAIANAPAALTGSFVTIIVALPLLGGVAPEVFEKIDPLNAMTNLISAEHTAASAATLTGGCSSSPRPARSSPAARRSLERRLRPQIGV
jgi:hypothetical protein